MKRILLIAIGILFAGQGPIYSQHLLIPYSIKPTIDGHLLNSEWSSADSIEIAISRSRKTKVFLMHDSLNFYVAFVNNLKSGGNYFPELVIDTDHDQASSFQSDDWWFHVSATDCEYQGEYGNYANCNLSRPNWTAIPNFTPGNTVDTVEIAIPFNSIGITVDDTVGIGFLLNNFMGFKLYPTSLKHLEPNTYLAASFELAHASSISEQEFLASSIMVFPTSGEGLVKVRFDADFQEGCQLFIHNMLGQIVYQERLENHSDFGTKQIDLSNQPSGMYFFNFNYRNQSISKKIIIR